MTSKDNSYDSIVELVIISTLFQAESETRFGGWNVGAFDGLPEDVIEVFVDHSIFGKERDTIAVGSAIRVGGVDFTYDISFRLDCLIWG